MDRQTAIRLHRKLRALAADRAAQPGEKAVATAKADALERKFNLRAHETRQRARPRTRRRRRAWRSPPAGWEHWGVPDWSFDTTTGRGSRNVKVLRYQDRSNWKIQVDLTNPNITLGRGE